jgi:hypothetical protein
MMSLLNNLSLHKSLTLASTTPLLTNASGIALAEHTFFGADFGCRHIDAETFRFVVLGCVALGVKWEIMAIKNCGVTEQKGNPGAEGGPLRV